MRLMKTRVALLAALVATAGAALARPSGAPLGARAPSGPPGVRARTARASRATARSVVASASASAANANTERVAQWAEADIVVAEGPAPAAGGKLAPIDPPAWFAALAAAALPAPAGLGLDGLRAAGGAQLAALAEAGALPVSKSEAWRQLNVRELYQRALGTAPAAPAPAAIDPSFLATGADAVAVFVDGAYAPALSRRDGLPADAYVGGLAGLEAGARAALVASLDALGDPLANANTLGLADSSAVGSLGCGAFAALNSAAAVDVAAVLVPTAAKGAVTVQLIFVTTGAARATHPRWAVEVGAGVELALVTTHVDAADCARGGAAAGAAAAAGGALTNAVGQLRLGDGAIVHHSLCVERGAGATHIETAEAAVGADAQYRVTTLQSPAALSRVNVGVTLNSPGAQGHARGLMLSGGDSASSLDLHTTIRHLTRGCSSSQLQKTLLAQQGRAVFRGLIRANAQASQTVAHQLSRSMLLSDGAKLDVLPCLEIIADDVECTHGATVAELDEEKVFYFRARGISAEAARFALVKGFALEMLADVPYEGLKERMSAQALKLIPGKAPGRKIDTTGWASI